MYEKSHIKFDENQASATIDFILRTEASMANY